MNDTTPIASLPENLAHVRAMITRIRNKEGGLGSPHDELVLHRVIHDAETLLTGIETLKASYDEMVRIRDARIGELEAKLGLKQDHAEPGPAS